MKVIEVKNISKTYTLGTAAKDSIIDSFRTLFQSTSKVKTTFDALKDISFDVNKGEVLGIVGKNGAGKSTLLKILSRITEPTSGEIIMRGRVASLLEVGTGFHPELSGRENIFLNGSILGMTRSEIKSKFDEIVAFSGVEKFIDTPVKNYSSGMYVRLAFSVAAHLEPEVLIIDEVLAVGDAEFQKKCLGKMKDVAGEGRTVLFVSHNMSAVKSLCTNAIWLESGKVLMNGGVDNVVSSYLSGQKVKSFKISAVFKKVGTGIKAISFIDIGNKTQPFFANEEPINLKVDVFIEEDISLKGLDLNCSLFKQNTKVLMFFATDVLENNQFNHGNNTIIFKIPPGLLNKGDFHFNLLLHSNQKNHIHQLPEVMSFEVVTNSEKINKYSGIRQSLINI